MGRAGDFIPSMEKEAEAARWRTLDLFCGAAGGWTLGLHRAGFVTVAACEIDPWRRAVFGRNNPCVRLYEDVRSLDADRLCGDLGFLPEIVCGSPPCQDASAANAKGRGVDGERTGLFFEAVRLVREVRPRWVLFENVPGLRTRGYDRVHDALEEAGYAVWPLVVGAVHAGAPHLRKRVWIVAADAERDEGRWFEQVRLAAERSALSTRHDTGGNAADRDEARRLSQFAAFRRAMGTTAGQTAERNPLASWAEWQGGPPDLGRVDDGISDVLASRRGLGGACLAAYGDAVLPQITEAIGRAIRLLDRAEF
jgi:DNA (cytosine-5)-methyltransferase 1